MGKIGPRADFGSVSGLQARSPPFRSVPEGRASERMRASAKFERVRLKTERREGEVLESHAKGGR